MLGSEDSETIIPVSLGHKQANLWSTSKPPLLVLTLHAYYPI